MSWENYLISHSWSSSGTLANSTFRTYSCDLYLSVNFPFAYQESTHTATLGKVCLYTLYFFEQNLLLMHIETDSSREGNAFCLITYFCAFIKYKSTTEGEKIQYHLGFFFQEWMLRGLNIFCVLRSYLGSFIQAVGWDNNNLKNQT